MKPALLIGGGAAATLTLLAVGLTMATGGASGSGAPSGSSVDGWRDADAPRRIRRYARPIELEAGWPGLGDYLAAVAYVESRGKPAAVGDGGAANGWFQLHSDGLCIRELGLSSAQMVAAGERIQVVVAACHAYRLATVYASPGQRIEWRDIRRGWKYPSWVARSYRNTAGGRTSEQNLRRGLLAIHLPADRAVAPAFGPSFRWPGLRSLLEVTRGVV